MESDLNFKLPNLKLVPLTPQLECCLTIIRDRNTQRKEFILYADRVIRLLLESALNTIPITNCEIITPTGTHVNGMKFNSKICGVSVMRSGEAMERALREVCPGCRIGKILIQRSEITMDVTLYFHKLPDNISDRYILLLDPMLATGQTIIKAIDCLLKDGVVQCKIIIVSIVASKEGLKKVLDVYPDVTVVCATVDEGLNEHQFIIPGLGDFGDRYFGT